MSVTQSDRVEHRLEIQSRHVARAVEIAVRDEHVIACGTSFVLVHMLYREAAARARGAACRTTAILQGNVSYYNDTTAILQRYYSGTTAILQRYYSDTTAILRGNVS